MPVAPVTRIGAEFSSSRDDALTYSTYTSALEAPDCEFGQNWEKAASIFVRVAMTAGTWHNQRGILTLRGQYLV